MIQKNLISKYTPELIIDLVNRYYNMIVTDVKTLQSYDDLNFRVTIENVKYLVKLSVNANEGFIYTQNSLLGHLTDLDVIVSQCMTNVSGDNYVVIQEDDLILRLMTYVEGTFVSMSRSSIEPSFIGSFHGKLDHACSLYSDIRFSNDRGIWNLEYASQLKSYLEYIDDPYLRTLVFYFIQQFEVKVLSDSNKMTRGLIHNDFNFDNVLFVSDNELGVIDFGDMVYGPFAFSLAIGLAYYLLDSSNMVDDASLYTRAYRQIYNLPDHELSNLYYIIAARMCTSICSSSYKIKTGQSTPYIVKDRSKMITSLKALHQINPIRFSNSILCADNDDVSGEDLDELLVHRSSHFSTAMSLSYDTPIHMSHGSLQYMYGKNGTTYLDGVNNIMHVGHNNPYITHATTIQSSILNTNTRYVYNEIYTYTEKLLSKFPSNLNKVFFVNSGSAATDLALRIANSYTQNKDVFVMDHAYHGNTISALNISPYKFNGKGGSGKPDNVHVMRIPNNASDDATIDYEIDRLEKHVQANPVTFILESILGCGGQLVLPANYVRQICKTVQSNGGLYIADEVQVGFGRVGSHYWGYELYDVSPDIIILGKPIGNGHPMGAVVCTEDVCSRFESGMEFFSSFGGNPVSCAIGEQVLNIIDRDDLQSHAKTLGTYMYNQWKTLANEFDCICDVRGLGLFLGLEIVDSTTKKPDAALATNMVNILKEKYHILLSIDGPHHNIIKFKPSMYFTKENADILYSAFRAILL